MATKSDVLMFFKLASGPLAAESQSAALTRSDALLAGFTAGCFFEVETFSFGIRLKSNESGEDVDFANWRAYHDTGGASSNPPFRAVPTGLTITRLIEKSSPPLLQYCLELKEISKAVLVKRESVGEETPSGFLRFEMDTVTIKSINWSDGEVLREAYGLEFKDLLLTYVQRRDDGSMVKSWPGEWHRPR